MKVPNINTYFVTGMRGMCKKRSPYTSLPVYNSIITLHHQLIMPPQRNWRLTWSWKGGLANNLIVYEEKCLHFQRQLSYYAQSWCSILNHIFPSLQLLPYCDTVDFSKISTFKPAHACEFEFKLPSKIHVQVWMCKFWTSNQKSTVVLYHWAYQIYFSVYHDFILKFAWEDLKIRLVARSLSSPIPWLFSCL